MAEEAEAAPVVTMSGTDITSTWDGAAGNSGMNVLPGYCHCGPSKFWPGENTQLFTTGVPTNVPYADRDGSPLSENCRTNTQGWGMDCRVISSFTATGSPGADSFIASSSEGGTSLAVTINAGEGDDTVHAAGYGSRQLHGEGGSDTFSTFFTQAGTSGSTPQTAWTIDLQAGTATGNSVSPHTITNFENVQTTQYGSDTAEQIVRGTDGPNFLATRGGDDTFDGRGEADTIFSGAGDDTITGGPGGDTINCGPGDDTVTDPGAGDVLTECETDSAIVVNESGDDTDTDTADSTCDTDDTKDGSQCSLRAALQEANAQSGSDKIEFELPASEGKRIAPAAPFPVISGPVTIDGLTQGGSRRGPSTEPVINISGSLQTGNEPGLDVQAPNVEIKGLILTSFKFGPSIRLGGGSGKVLGNWFGVRRSGNSWKASKNGVGVEVRSAGNQIGGAGTEAANVFGAHGDVKELADYAQGLDRDGSTPQDLHAAALGGFGQGILVGAGASGTTISGNSFGRAPDGTRIGSKLDFGSIKFGNVAGITIAPTGGTASGTLIGGSSAADANTFAANMFGILITPGTGGSVSGVDVGGNLIGPKAPNSPSSFFGNVMGLVAAGNVTGLDVGGSGEFGNDIQGNGIGLVLGNGVNGATVQNNDIGIDKNLNDMVDDLKKKEPSIGLHNFMGAILGDTQNVQFGGTDLGNRVFGNFIGLQLAGSSSETNTVAGNAFGLANAPAGKIESMKLGKAGSVIGLLHAKGSQNIIGLNGAGNTFKGTAIGLLSGETVQETVRGNTFDKNAIGELSFAPAGSVIGGSAPGHANSYVNGGLGLVLAHRDLKKDEEEAARTDGNPTSKKERKDVYTAENTDLALDTAAPLVGDADLSADVVSTPPAPGTNNLVQGNFFGTDGANANLGNWIGAWFIGDISASTFGTGPSSMMAGANTVAHNRTAGVWVGPPVSGTSQIDLRGNSIFDNHTFTGPSRGLQGLGIDLLPPGSIDSGSLALSFGISPNDAGDADPGGNGRQNYPEISSATAAGDALTVEGTLSSAASTTYSIELYASANCGRFAFGEGQTLIKRYDVTTAGDGSASINTTATLPAGKRKLTATATGPGGTSEFSECNTVP